MKNFFSHSHMKTSREMKEKITISIMTDIHQNYINWNHEIFVVILDTDWCFLLLVENKNIERKESKWLKETNRRDCNNPSFILSLIFLWFINEDLLLFSIIIINIWIAAHKKKKTQFIFMLLFYCVKFIHLPKFFKESEGAKKIW